MERRKATFNGNRNGNRNGSRGNYGKRTFGPTDAYELPSAQHFGGKSHCGGPQALRRGRRALPPLCSGKAGIHDKDAFYDALHSLKDKGEITVDKDHWVKLVPRGGDIEAQIVSLSSASALPGPSWAARTSSSPAAP